MTKTAGVLFIVLAAVVLGAGIVNFAGQCAAAGPVADQFKSVDLATTDLRWSMGVEFLLDFLVAAVTGIVGWFLFGSETEQYAYVILTGLLLIGGTVIRFSPLVPLSAARMSSNCFFLAAQVKLTLNNDDTTAYTTLPVDTQDYRIGRVEGQSEKETEVLLDFHGDQTLEQAYWSGPWPVTIIGSMGGTRTIINNATNRKGIFLVPRVKVWKIGAQ
jgi:hypothetical protein